MVGFSMGLKFMLALIQVHKKLVLGTKENLEGRIQRLERRIEKSLLF